MYFEMMQPNRGSLLKTKTTIKINSKNKVNFFQGINNLFANAKSRFNGGIIPFKPSYLVNRFSILGNLNAIKEIIKWNNLDKDEDFLHRLFEKNYFDEISYLLYSEKYSRSWVRTKEHFRLVIHSKELDLIIYFLQIRDCRTVLEEPQIQEFIVRNYMK
jgi:hypothetical protein